MYEQISNCLENDQNYYYIMYIQRIFQCTVKYSLKIIGPVMLAFGILLITFVCIVYLAMYNPYFYQSTLELSPNFPIHTIPSDALVYIIMRSFIFLFLVYNVFYHYLSCVLTSPGTPKPCDNPGLYMGQTAVRLHDGRRAYQINYSIEVDDFIYYKYCKHCHCIKPPRCHHDSVTGKCVYHMDHYCPWVNNTIGYYNYRHFILFLFYTTLGSMYLLIHLTFSYYFYSDARKVSYLYFDALAMHAAALFLSSISFAGVVSVGGLLMWHVYLCCSNQTTIEFYMNQQAKATAAEYGVNYRNPFDQGWRKNLKRVFGDDIFLGFLPTKINLLPPEYPFDLPELINHA